MLGFFSWGGGGRGGKGGRVSFQVTTTLMNRSEELQVEIGLKHIGTT